MLSGWGSLPQPLACSGQPLLHFPPSAYPPHIQPAQVTHLLPGCCRLPTSRPSGCQQGVSRYTWIPISPSHKTSPSQSPQGPAEPSSCPLPSSPLNSFTPPAPAPGHPANLERGNPIATTGPLHLLLPLLGCKTSHSPPRDSFSTVHSSATTFKKPSLTTLAEVAPLGHPFYVSVRVEHLSPRLGWGLREGKSVWSLWVTGPGAPSAPQSALSWDKLGIQDLPQQESPFPNP